MAEPTSYSVAEARSAFADILNRVAYSGEIVTIVKYGEPVARITPIIPKISQETINAYFGMWKDKPWARDIGKPSRRFRKGRTASFSELHYRYQYHYRFSSRSRRCEDPHEVNFIERNSRNKRDHVRRIVIRSLSIRRLFA